MFSLGHVFYRSQVKRSNLIWLWMQCSPFLLFCRIMLASFSVTPCVATMRSSNLVITWARTPSTLSITTVSASPPSVTATPNRPPHTNSFQHHITAGHCAQSPNPCHQQPTATPYPRFSASHHRQVLCQKSKSVPPAAHPHPPTAFSITS